MTAQHGDVTGETTAIERVERARGETMALSVIRDEPYVVQVENEQSGRVHTVVPEAPHCSCEDHTYRNTVCKHMIRVLECGKEAAVVLEEALEDREQTLQEQLTDLQEEVNQVRSEADGISAVLEEVSPHQQQPVVDDQVEALTNNLLADN